MKEYFKRKKIIITGHEGFKSDWLRDLLVDYDANVMGIIRNQSPENIKTLFKEEQPEIVFHIALPTGVAPNNELHDAVLSPYVGTAAVLDAIKDTPSVTSAVVIPSEIAHLGGTWYPSLDEEEKKQLAHLLEKVDNVQIRGEIWHQLVKKIITVPIELCITDENNNVFLVYRKDREFDGYHMPGTVINDWETVEEACNRLVKGEVIRDAGITISSPYSIGWLEVRRGLKEEESTTRNAISLLFTARLEGDFVPQEGKGFFSFDNLPENTLGHHKFILRYFRKNFEDGSIILGR